MSSDEGQLTNLYDLSRAQLAERLAAWGFSDYYAGLVWSGLYRDLVAAPADMVGLRPELGRQLAAETTIDHLAIRSSIDSVDGHTRKYLLGLRDGAAIETVLMYFRGRATACVSTQVGCAMGCVFCATGQMGFRRHLSPGEIVAQIIHVQRVLRQRGEQLRNIVLMGMGEPLHNYDATMAALDTIMDHRGLAIAPRFITCLLYTSWPGASDCWACWWRLWRLWAQCSAAVGSRATLSQSPGRWTPRPRPSSIPCRPCPRPRRRFYRPPRPRPRRPPTRPC